MLTTALLPLMNPLLFSATSPRLYSAPPLAAWLSCQMVLRLNSVVEP